MILIFFIRAHNVQRITERLENVNENLHTFGRIVDKQEKLLHVKDFSFDRDF